MHGSCCSSVANSFVKVVDNETVLNKDVMVVDELVDDDEVDEYSR